jgi:hypothetical protein
MKKRSFLIGLLIAALMLAACAAAAPQALPEDEFARGAAPGAPPMEAPAAVEEADGVVGVGQDLASSGSAQAERLVIKNASLWLLVEDPGAASENVARLADSMGGFVVSTNIFESTFGPNSIPAKQASMVIRVPAERLTEALTQIKALAVEVTSEQVSGQDVTSDYTDLQSRLRNLQAAEEQLQNIMDGATRTEDVLAVYNELVRVRGEIEVIQGQIKYYEESAAFSQVSIELVPDVAAQPVEIGGWRPVGAVKEAFELLIRSLQVLVEALIYVAICGVPLALLFGVPGWLVARGLRRRRQKTAEAAAPPAPPAEPAAEA